MTEIKLKDIIKEEIHNLNEVDTERQLNDIFEMSKKKLSNRDFNNFMYFCFGVLSQDVKPSTVETIRDELNRRI